MTDSEDGNEPKKVSQHDENPVVNVEVSLLGKLPTQGGGHGKIQKSICPSSSIPSVAKPFIKREDTFYRRIISTPLGHSVPRYQGSYKSGVKKWLLLEDLTYGFLSPCIIDIKLGTRSYEVDASPQKKQAQLNHSQNTTTASHAIRLIDARIRKDGEVVEEWDRHKGHDFTAEDFQKTLQQFFQGKRRSEFVTAIMKIRTNLLETLNILPRMRLYSASVLAIYDGDKTDAPMRVALIDFAHAYTDVDAEGGDSNDSSYDDNSLKGLQNLINFLLQK